MICNNQVHDNLIPDINEFHLTSNQCKHCQISLVHSWMSLVHWVSSLGSALTQSCLESQKQLPEVAQQFHTRYWSPLSPGSDSLVRDRGDVALHFTWSTCLRHSCWSSVSNRYDSGPRHAATWAGTQSGPGRNFLTMTRSPTANLLVTVVRFLLASLLSADLDFYIRS